MGAIKARVFLAGALLALLLAAYSNHFHNSFHFDDAHTIVNNAAIRDLGNIPLFFRDAATFSSLPSNQSYRPLVSTLLAVDYSLGRGLRPLFFHLSIFGLFLVLVFLLCCVLEQLLKNETCFGKEKDPKEFRAGETPAPDARGGRVPRNWWIALFAAALYGLHPANADTINYIIASADIISTLGIIASFAIYFAFPGWRRSCLFVLPAAVGVLAKPPAAVFAVLFAIYCLLFSPNEARLRRSVWAWCSEAVPPLLICAALVWFVQHMTPHTWVAGAANSHHYLITQPYVILQYFKTFLWPAGLSADYDLNPFATTDDARFWMGFAFVVLFSVAAIVAAIFQKTRVIGFGLLWFLVALLPTSLFPLAEVMNDHRTFLPYIGPVIALAGAVSLLVRRFEGVAPVKIAVMSAAALVLGASAYGTFQRNKVWKDEEALWRDVTLKSPGNGRGLMNYGNTLMAKGNFAGALDYYHRAQVLTPQYAILLINLAIAEDATHQTAVAEQHFRDALRLTPSTPDGYTYYARFLIDHARPEEARALLEHAIVLSPSDILARDLLGRIHAPTPESLLALSLRHYGEKRYADCIAASRAALALRPNYAEAWNNIGAAYNQLGQFKEAAAACERALQARPDFELARNNLAYARAQMQTPRE